MRKLRDKVLQSKLENLLFKYERRIQKIAEQAYKVRQALEAMEKEKTDAVR